MYFPKSHKLQAATAPHTTATLHSAEQQLRKLMQSPSTTNHARQLLCSQQL